MRIISPFKDYYDYVATQYGGGDPKILYMRNRLTEEQLKHTIRGLQFLPNTFRQRELEEYDFKWLMVCGYQYLLVGDKFETNLNKFRLFSRDAFPEVAKNIVGRYIRQNQYETYTGKFREENVELSRKVGAPVFVIDRVAGSYYTFVTGQQDDQTVFINENIPLLTAIGLPSVKPAEQLYQDLEYFIVNKMKKCPDTQPVGNPGQTDKEKIASHGFDLKVSFRHR